MSNCGCNQTPCAPAQFCTPENFGLLFPSLVGPQGPPGGPGTYVLSFVELRALDPTEFPEGYVANVIGHTEANDGGGGVFSYSPTSTADDNNGTIVEPNNGIGRWLRVYTGPVSAKWFGATGDGVTNDVAALQGAIDWIESTSAGGVLYLPTGTYLIASQLTISGIVNFHMFGDGWGPGGTVIQVSGAGNALDMGNVGFDRTVDLRIEHMKIDGDGTGNIGIIVNQLHHILLNRVRIQNFLVGGVDLNMAYNNELRDLYIDDCARGIIVDENNEYTLIFRCKIFNCSTIGIHFRNGSCSGSKIMFCDIESNEIGIKVDCGAVENVESFGIIGCYFKDQAAENVSLGTDASSFWIDSLLFENNEIKAGTAGAGTNTVELDRCRKPVLLSNTFNNADVVTSVYNTANLVELGNTYNGSAEPGVAQLGNASGNLKMQTLPTSDPGVTDELWNDTGFVAVSP